MRLTMKKIFMLAAFTLVLVLSGCLGFGGGAWGGAPYYDGNNQRIYQQGRYRDGNQDRNQRQDQGGDKVRAQQQEPSQDWHDDRGNDR